MTLKFENGFYVSRDGEEKYLTRNFREVDTSQEPICTLQQPPDSIFWGLTVHAHLPEFVRHRLTTNMKSQEAAFKAARKPAPKPKIVQPRNTATPKRVTKNAARNERRKAARKTASLLKAQKGGQGEKEIEKEEAVASEGAMDE